MNTLPSATFKKLNDGSWGLLVNAMSLTRGSRVVVTKKNTTQRVLFVDKVKWSGNGVSICTFTENAPAASVDEVETTY